MRCKDCGTELVELGPGDPWCPKCARTPAGRAATADAVAAFVRQRPELVAEGARRLVVALLHIRTPRRGRVLRSEVCCPGCRARLICAGAPPSACPACSTAFGGKARESRTLPEGVGMWRCRQCRTVHPGGSNDLPMLGADGGFVCAGCIPGDR